MRSESPYPNCHDQGVVREADELPCDRGGTPVGCPPKNRGCATAGALVICAFFIPLFVLYTLVIVIARAASELSEWALK